MWHSFGKLSKDISSTQEEIRLLLSVVSSESELMEQEKALIISVEGLGSNFPNEGELPLTIEALSAMATKAHVRIRSIFPQRPIDAMKLKGGSDAKAKDTKNLGYKEIPIQINGQAGYHQVGTFLSLIESSDKPMILSNFRISGNDKDPKRHNVQLLIVAYFSTDI